MGWIGRLRAGVTRHLDPTWVRGLVVALLVLGCVLAAVALAANAWLSRSPGARVLAVVVLAAVVLFLASHEVGVRALRWLLLLFVFLLIVALMTTGRAEEVAREGVVARQLANELFLIGHPDLGEELCQELRGSTTTLEPIPGADAPLTICDERTTEPTVREMRVAAARAELAVAEREAAAARQSQPEPSPPDEPAEDPAEVVDARRGLALAAAQSEPPLLTDLVTGVPLGARTAFANFPLIQSPSVGVVPGLFGWTVILVSLIVLYGAQERRAATQRLGPVRIGAVSGLPDEQKAEFEAVLRSTIVRNLPEPSTIPGGGESGAPIDLIDLVAASPGPAGNVLAAISQVMTRPVGFTVAVDCQPVANGGVAAVVRVLRARDGETVVTRAARGAKTDAAARTAGYVAAAWIIGESRGVAPWNKWYDATAEALAAYDQMDDTEDGEPPADPREPLADPSAGDHVARLYGPQIDQLERALRHAPTSGLLLTRTAALNDLGGEHTRALELNARASASYPRFFVASYRTALSLSTAAHEPGKSLPPKDEAAGAVVRAQLQNLGDRYNLKQPYLEWLDSEREIEMRAACVELSHLMLQRLYRRANPVTTLLRAFRRDERAEFFAVLPFRTGWQHPHRLPYSAQLGVNIRRIDAALALPDQREELEEARRYILTARHAVADPYSPTEERFRNRSLANAYIALSYAELALGDLLSDQVGGPRWDTLRSLARLTEDARVRLSRARWLFWFGERNRQVTSAHSLARRADKAVRRLARRHRVSQLGRRVARTDRWAQNPRAPWQVTYNYTCFLVAVKDLEGAIQMLERTIERPGSVHLTRAWLESDPALEGLRQRTAYNARLERVIARVDPDAPLSPTEPPEEAD